LYEIAGTRGAYVIDGDAWATSWGVLDAKEGDLVILCPESGDSVYTLPGAWAGRPLSKYRAAAKIMEPPRSATTWARYGAQHVASGTMAEAAADGTWTLDVTRVLVLAQVTAVLADGSLELGGWTARGVRPELRAALRPKQSVWLVGDVRLEPSPDGAKPTLVLDVVDGALRILE
jgi:hypothetical protein